MYSTERHAPDRRRLPSSFHRFWLAAAVSNLGDGIRLAALPLLAIELTDDARLIAGVTAVTFLPWVIAGPLTGVLVDRVNRRPLMLVGQVGRAAAVLALAAAVSGGWATIWLLYAAALAVGVGETLVDSASQAAIPHLVDDRDLERANGRIIVAQTLFDGVVGVAAGAMLFAWASSLPFYVDAATFVLGAAFLRTVKTPLQGHPGKATTSIRHDVWEGLRFLLRHRFLRGMAMSVAVNNVGLHMGLSVMVILVLQELGSPEATYGLILGVGAVGGVLGSAVAGRMTEWLTPRVLLSVVHVPFIASALVFAVASQPWMVALAFGLSSYALVTFKVPSQAARQRVTPDRLLGRTVTAFRIFGLGGPVVGAPIGGVLTEMFGVRAAFGAGAAVMVVSWILLLAALHHYPTTEVDDGHAFAPSTSSRGDGTPRPGQGGVAADVDDHVVGLLGVGEIRARVVDDGVGAERRNQVDLGGAADAGDMRAKGPGDLDRVGRARPRGHGALGVAAGAGAQHRVAGDEAGHGRADRFDDPGEVSVRKRSASARG